MAVKETLVTVTTTPTLLADPGLGRDHADTVWFEVANGSAATVYLGGPNVTTTSGRPVVAGASWSATLGKGDALYGVVAAATADVNTFKSRV